MRWKDKPQPIVGDTRTRSWFALLPVKIGDETRWLEWVTVKDKYVKIWRKSVEGCRARPDFWEGWIPKGFVKWHKENSK